MPNIPKPLSYIHIGMFTNNPKRLIKFYQSTFDFKQEKVNFIPQETIKQAFKVSCDCHMAVLALDDIRLEIFYSDSLKFKKKVREAIGLNHWGYFVKDKHKLAQQLEKSGVKVKKIKRGDHFVYFVSDPDANLIELMEPPKGIPTR